ncbi:hypothetical protein [Bartonella australis]|uniref:hypothetical protein n=1 Tax=Bartonella australis TaxID=388640 RepID=UPI00034ADFD4|nr:hypothetical protein [Bartonella australis]
MEQIAELTKTTIREMKRALDAEERAKKARREARAAGLEARVALAAAKGAMDRLENAFVQMDYSKTFEEDSMPLFAKVLEARQEGGSGEEIRTH